MTPSAGRLRGLRMSAGLSQSALARMIGISRQAYVAIEGGGARPSVDVALRIAHALDSTVEALFGAPSTSLDATLARVTGSPPAQPFPVRVAEVGGRRIAFPTRGFGGRGVAPADGLATADAVAASAGAVQSDDAARQARVELFPSRPRSPDLVVVGCDPAFGLAVDALRQERGLEVLWLQAGSRAALEMLARGEAHVAGIHLLDPATGRYNRPWVDRLVPVPCTLVRFATWEEGLLVAASNPLGIRSVEDLARPSLRFVNREAGSGSRALLDRTLREHGVDAEAIPGYEHTSASGHLEVAAAVACGAADAGIGIRAAGALYGLDALTLEEEPYDLVVPSALLDHPPVQALIDLLGRRALRTQVAALGGYDTSGMGTPA